jgi:N-hydroxyarylamine O-acetyltransferase
VEAVLTKLGFRDAPAPDLHGLQQLYRSWCERVPFDNGRKLVALRQNSGGALPGDSATDFFQAYLAHGTGATCWAVNGALCTLLQCLGFNARRGFGTMLVAPDLPPNHGTVLVTLEQRIYLVDASLLTVDPLLLDEHVDTAVNHPAWGVQCRREYGKWLASWRPQMRPEGLDCRLDVLDATAKQFSNFHEGTRAWGPFNYEFALRANRNGGVVGVAYGQRVDFDSTGQVVHAPMNADERVRFLVETVGWSEETAVRLPADIPTPPPPGSRTAMALGS